MPCHRHHGVRSPSTGRVTETGARKILEWSIFFRVRIFRCAYQPLLIGGALVNESGGWLPVVQQNFQTAEIFSTMDTFRTWVSNMLHSHATTGREKLCCNKQPRLQASSSAQVVLSVNRQETVALKGYWVE